MSKQLAGFLVLVITALALSSCARHKAEESGAQQDPDDGGAFSGSGAPPDYGYEQGPEGQGYDGAPSPGVKSDGREEQPDLDSMDRGQARGLVGVEPNDLSKFTDPSSPLYQRLIYFEYDSDVIRSEFRQTIRAHANYIKRHNVRVRLEGHADERGTREYNIALGERRANAVMQALLFEGVPANRITTLSYGEERPAAYGHNEQAWSQNRRVEIIYVR